MMCVFFMTRQIRHFVAEQSDVFMVDGFLTYVPLFRTWDSTVTFSMKRFPCLASQSTKGVAAELSIEKLPGNTHLIFFGSIRGPFFSDSPKPEPIHSTTNDDDLPLSSLFRCFREYIFFEVCLGISSLQPYSTLLKLSRIHRSYSDKICRWTIWT